MSPLEWLATGAGVALVAGALREVFHTLLYPSGAGQMTPAVFRVVWAGAHPAGGRAVQLAGPLAVVASIVIWALMLVVGWALVYWPHLPEQFQVAQGIPVSRQGSLADAVYVPAVALATLGYGDIVAEETLLRLALSAEAVIGFALLTASISWVLSIYPALMRRRALAARITTLLSEIGEATRLRAGDPPTVLAVVLHGIAERLATAQVDLIQYPSSYFFHGPSQRLSLPEALPRLRQALTRDDLPPKARAAAQVVLATLEDLSRTLRDGPFPLTAGSPEATLAAYAADHRS